MLCYICPQEWWQWVEWELGACMGCALLSRGFSRLLRVQDLAQLEMTNLGCYWNTKKSCLPPPSPAALYAAQAF